jgi:hypothetical protein
VLGGLGEGDEGVGGGVRFHGCDGLFQFHKVRERVLESCHLKS